jgi:hypothetical protein
MNLLSMCFSVPGSGLGSTGMPREVRIRDARHGEAEQIARVHVESWQEAYRGHLPDEYLSAGIRYPKADEDVGGRNHGESPPFGGRSRWSSPGVRVVWSKL